MRTSSGLEAVAFINALVHHPLVYPHFAADAAAAESRMPAEVVRAVTALREISERKLRGAPSATIFKPLVAASMVLGEPIDSIEEVVRLLDQPERLEEAMMRVQELTGPRNSYYSREGFRDFLDMAPRIALILRYLERSGFEDRWREQVAPDLRAKAAQLLPVVREYNVVPEVERMLGFTLPSDHVVFYLLHYIKPFGNHILPGYFASEPWIPPELLVRTAVHELLHDPCYSYDPEFWRAMTDVLADPFVSAAYKSRDPKYGYNNPGYFAVENSVRVLEQLASEELGVARPIRERWNALEDGGMHVIAPALYVLMKEEMFPREGEGFRAFVIRMYRNGTLRKGKIEPLVRRFVKTYGGI